MIRLFVENPERSDANLPVRWCIDPETLQELKDKEAVDPMLLLVIAKKDNPVAGVFNYEELQRVEGVEQRKLVPLGQEMEYFQLYAPGNYTIHAVIVWKTSYRDPVDFFLKSRHGAFSWGLVDYYRNEFSRYYLESLFEDSNLDYGSLTINVPLDFFAKEPPKWEWWYVNLWFKNLGVPSPANQCIFRRRRIFAYTVQPLPFLLCTVLKIAFRLAVYIILLSCGFRGLCLRAVVRPYAYDNRSVWRENEGSYFVIDSEGERRPFWMIFLTPLIVFSFCGVVTLFYWALGWKGLLALLCFFVISGLISLAFIFGGKLFSWFRSRCFLSEYERLVKRQEKEAKLARQRAERFAKKKLEMKSYYDNFQNLVCRGVPLKPRVELLPKNRQTIHLKFNALKAKVCKPFART